MSGEVVENLKGFIPRYREQGETCSLQQGRKALKGFVPDTEKSDRPVHFIRVESLQKL
jgi:hypothetical protein